MVILSSHPIPFSSQYAAHRRREETTLLVGNPCASASPDIVVNRWIKWDLINGGGSPISFIDRVNQQPSD